MKIRQVANKQVVYLLCVFAFLIGFAESGNCAYQGIGKNEIPELSATQMAADYSYFVKKLKEIYPYTRAWGEVTKEDVGHILDSIGEQVGKCKSTEEFVWNIYKCLNIFPDKHLEVPHVNTLKYYKKNEQQYGILITDEVLRLNNYYYTLLHDSVYVKVRLGLRFKYINGKYYSLREFSHEELFYQKGVELIEINKQSVNKFVENNRLSIPNICWDQERGQYFSDYLLLTPEIAGMNEIELSFKIKEGDIQKAIYHLNETVTILSKAVEIKDEPLVSMIDDSVLYIRMPFMFNEQFYLERINSLKTQKQQIAKVIIDIRNNRGGMDVVWKKLLQNIIDSPLTIHTKFSVNPSSTIKDYISKQGFDTLQLKSTRLFENEYLAMSNENEILAPDSLSLNYNGKIYILTDEDSFSAASSLISMSKEEERLVSIGYRSCIIGGRGLTPLIIQLPNSKLIVRMPFTMDCTGRSKIDIMHNIPEIEEKYTISNYLEKYYTANPYSEDHLVNTDPLFKKALYEF